MEEIQNVCLPSEGHRMFDLLVITSLFAMLLAPCIVALRAVRKADLLPIPANLAPPTAPWNFLQQASLIQELRFIFPHKQTIPRSKSVLNPS